MAATENISQADNETLVVAGHGEIGGREDLIEFREMLLSICDKVATLKETGRSLKGVVSEKPTSGFDDRWAGGLVGPELFVSLVYRGL